MEKDTYDTLPPIKYDTNIAAIQKLGEQYMPLIITDLDDKEQFKSVHEARMVMVKVRTTIEKKRKAQKAAALDYGRAVDAAAGKLYDVSNPIEEHLQAQEQKVVDEQNRIKEEAERIEREKIQTRVDTFQSFGVVLPFMDVATMTDEEFNLKLSETKAAFETEQERLAKEKAEREAEEKRLAEERAELERKQAEQDARDKEAREKAETLRIEREAFEREKREAQEAKDREAFEKQAKENARILVEKEVKEKVEREKREAKEREESEKAEAKRQEALKPDKEKLIAWIKSFNTTNIPEPKLLNREAKLIFNNAHSAIIDILQAVEDKAEEM